MFYRIDSPRRSSACERLRAAPLCARSRKSAPRLEPATAPRHCLRSRQYAFGCKALRRSHANAQSLSGFHQTDHFSSIVSWGIFGKSKTFAQFADANGRPGLAISGFAAHSIERYGELAIGPVASEFPECINGRRRHVTGVSAGFHSGNADLAVASTSPVHQQHSFVCGIVQIADDLLNQYMDEALLGASVGRRRVGSTRYVRFR